MRLFLGAPCMRNTDRKMTWNQCLWEAGFLSNFAYWCLFRAWLRQQRCALQRSWELCALSSVSPARGSPGSGPVRSSPCSCLAAEPGLPSQNFSLIHPGWKSYFNDPLHVFPVWALPRGSHSHRGEGLRRHLNIFKSSWYCGLEIRYVHAFTCSLGEP